MDELEAMFPENVEQTDFTNFCFYGTVEIDLPSLWARVTVEIVNGEILKNGKNYCLDILEMTPLNRDGKSLKTFHNGDWLCKYIFFNNKDNPLYQVKVEAWEKVNES